MAATNVIATLPGVTSTLKALSRPMAAVEFARSEFGQANERRVFCNSVLLNNSHSKQENVNDDKERLKRCFR